MRGYLIPHLGAIPLKRLRTADIQGMFRHVGANPGPYDPVLAGSTLQSVRATLQNALKDAIRRGLIEHNPAKNVGLPKKAAQPARICTQQREEIYRRTGQRPRVAVWRRDHLVRFITSIQDDELFPLWLLAGMLGPRRGELAGLRLIDHDFEASEITIDHQSDCYKGRHIHHRTKTPKGEHTLPLDQYTNQILANQILANQILANHVRSQLIRAQAGGDTPGSMFTRNGKPLTRSWITATFRKKVEALDLPPVRLHDLRHGSATNALASGSHIKLIQEKLGHADFGFSLETYVHVLGELAHQAISRWPTGSSDRHSMTG